MTERVITIEEALEKTGFAHYNLYLFAFYGWAVLAITLELFGTFYIIPAMAVDLGTTSVQLIIFAQLSTIGLCFSTHFWGYKTDTRGRREILSKGSTMMYIFGTCAAFSPHWTVVTFFKFASSVSVTAVFVSSFPLLVECTPKTKRRSIVILITSILLVVLGIMSVLSARILSIKFKINIPVLDIDFNSWRLQCILFALPSLFIAIGVRYFYESPKYLLVAGKEREALEVLRGIYQMNKRTSAENYEVDRLILDEDIVSTKEQRGCKALRARLKGMMHKPRVIYFTILMKSFVGSYVSIYCFMELTPIIVSVFMKSMAKGDTHFTICEMVRAHHDETLVDNYSMTMAFVVGVALAVFNVAFIAVVNYINRKKIILGIQILVTIAALCINFSPYDSLTLILFSCILSGALNFGLLYSYVVDVFPSFCMSMAVCLVSVAALGPPQLAATFIKKSINNNCEAAFYIIMGFSLLSVIFIFFLPSNETLSQNRKILNKMDETEPKSIELT